MNADEWELDKERSNEYSRTFKLKEDKKMEEPKQKEKSEREFVKDLEIEITKVEVIQSTNPKAPDEITKVEFETNKGKITYKPKTTKTEFRQGISVRKISPCVFDDLPENLFAISRAANEKGTVKVIATYRVWNVKQDGSPVTYRYVQGEKMFERWKLSNKEPTVETVG